MTREQIKQARRILIDHGENQRYVAPDIRDLLRQLICDAYETALVVISDEE